MDMAIVLHLAENFGSGCSFISQFWVVLIPTKEGLEAASEHNNIAHHIIAQALSGRE